MNWYLNPVLPLIMVVSASGATWTAAHRSVPGVVTSEQRFDVTTASIYRATPESETAAAGPGEDEFRQNCTPCHGDGGKGDGVAAVAFNPRPADLTKPETLGSQSDEDVLLTITKGRNAMPAFGPLLSPEVLSDVVAYVRSLSK
jgi:mono/diheme cytochrome c family protein